MELEVGNAMLKARGWKRQLPLYFFTFGKDEYLFLRVKKTPEEKAAEEAAETERLLKRAMGRTE